MFAIDTEKHCVNLTHPDCGSVKMNGLLEGATAEYQCEQYLVLVGMPTRTCEYNANGELIWSGSAPYCCK